MQIKIDQNDISKPIINAEVLDNIKEVLKQNIGIDLAINIIEPVKE